MSAKAVLSVMIGTAGQAHFCELLMHLGIV